MNFFGKSYNDLESELNDTKSKIQLLEEKIEGLIQKDINMTKLLHETNSKLQEKIEGLIQKDKNMTKLLHETNTKIQVLEEKLQKNTSSLISFGDNSKTKFIDINCSSINISYNSPFDSGNGFILLLDNVEIYSKTYTFETIYKFINELKNIENINFEWRFPLPDSFGTNEIPKYFKCHFDIIQKIIEINNKVKINMRFNTNFPFEWLKYMLKDLYIDNILGIEILYAYHVDKTEYITDLIKGLNTKLNTKIIFKNLYIKPIGCGF
jgi:hypothetical protein